MKNILIAVFTLSVSVSALNHQYRFLVQGQTVPPGLRLSISNVADFDRPEYEIDGNPLPVIDTRGFLLSVGGGACLTSLSGTHLLPSSSFPHFFYGSIFGTGGIGERWYWFSYHAYGIASDRFQFARGLADSYLQLTVAGYRISDSFLIGIGLAVNVQEGFSVLPLPMISYSTDNWIYALSPTGEARVTYKRSDDWELYGAAALLNRTFYFHDPDSGYARLDRTILSLGCMFRIWKYIFADIGMGCMADASLHFSGDLEDRFKRNLGAYGGVKVIVP